MLQQIESVFDVVQTESILDVVQTETVFDDVVQTDSVLSHVVQQDSVLDGTETEKGQELVCDEEVQKLEEVVFMRRPSPSDAKKPRA